MGVQIVPFRTSDRGVYLLRLRQAVHAHGVEDVHRLPIGWDLQFGLTESVAQSLGIDASTPHPRRTARQTSRSREDQDARRAVDRLKSDASARYREAAERVAVPVRQA